MLNKQILPMAFGQGINTKIDDKQQPLGVLRVARNIVFETINMLRKRNGYDLLRIKSLTNQVITDVERLSKYKNELVLFAENQLYSYSESADRAADKGALTTVVPESISVIATSSNYAQVDAVVVEGLKVFGYYNSSLQQKEYSVMDVATGSLLVSSAVIDTGAGLCKVANISNTIYLIYSNGSNIYYRRFNIFSPTTLSAPVAVANNLLTATSPFDCVSTDQKIIVAYTSTVVGDKVRLISILSTGIIGSGISVPGSATATAIDIKTDSSLRVVVTYCTATAAQFCVISFPLTSVLTAPVVVETIANLVNITAVETTPTQFAVYYEINNATKSKNGLNQNTFNSMSGAVGSPQGFKRGLGLAGKAFYHADTAYIPVAFDTQLQASYFLLDGAGTVVSKLQAGLGGGTIPYGTLPHTSLLAVNQWLFPNLLKTRALEDNGQFFSLLGVNSTTFNFDSAVKYENAILADNLHIGGGLLQMYDGNSVVEHGFNIYPEELIAGTHSGTGGNMSAGNYGYVAVYRWTDNVGQEHRSAASPVVVGIVTGGGSTQSQPITIPTLRLSAKTNVVIELYRTENNGTVFYLVTSPTAPIANDPSVDAITITDTLSDAQLISRQPLYTTGGVLENIASPATDIVAVHTASNRVFVKVSRNTMQYSKVRQVGFPVEFNDELTMDFDPVGGPITAASSMDEKFIVFEEDACFAITGEGPNNLGEQNTFTEPERLSADIGCIQASSIVLTPAGLMFKSRKGIYLLGRNLQLQYIGAQVEAYNSLNITSAKVVAEFNQARFTTSDGDCLVYNYQLGIWSTFSNFQALSAETVGNDYYYVRTDSTIFKENRASFTDAGSAISMEIETGWMSFAGIQGFQRVYRMLVLGTYKTPHSLQIQAAYDFNNAWVQSSMVQSSDVVTPSVYGNSSPYGAESPYGGDGKCYQMQFNFKRQKSQSIKLRITDFELQPGEGLSLSNFTLTIGTKIGSNKVADSRTFSVS